jgi:hypothetical protein
MAGMNTIATDGTAVLGEPAPNLRTNLRAYLASTGATGALTAGALTIFLGLAAFVGFDDMPLGGGGDAQGTILLDSGAGAPGAPEAAAVGLAAAPGAVAATPVAPAGGALAGGPGGSQGGGPGGGGITGPGGGPGGGTGGGGVPPGGGTPPATQPGVLGGTVNNLQNAVSGLGINAPLNNITAPITGPVDQILNNTLNQVGGILGAPRLGDRVNRTVNNVTGGLLGGGT